MTATEAREIAMQQVINSSEDYHEVLEVIREAAERGLFTTTVRVRNEVTISGLIEMGYDVTLLPSEYQENYVKAIKIRVMW